MSKKTYIIAEIGLNHDGNLEKALRMVEKAKEAGADAVKFQTFTAERLLNPLVFQKDGVLDNWIYQELKKVEIDESFHQQIQKKCLEIGIDFLSSPFDEKSLEIVACYCSKIKIASSEVTNLPLLEKVGKYGKPVILSTGIATLGEIEEAIFTLIKGGVTNLSLLHCVSLYPLSPEDANLSVIKTLQQAFSLPVGFSDHSLDDTLAIAAVAMGAQIIEKHVTLKRENRLFDHAISMELEELKIMVEKIRLLETAIGDGVKKISSKEMDVKKGSNKSFFASKDIQKGEILSEENIKAVRPLIGIPVKYQSEILGKKVKREIKVNYPIFWEDIDW